MSLYDAVSVHVYASVCVCVSHVISSCDGIKVVMCDYTIQWCYVCIHEAWLD